ncbi:MAG: BapA prefix-like domain-containing protein, partial [Gallionellaceae bacterium]|nr:BapA prefix-like domain-containing protein [Gallionellaceae bacterium]
MATNEDQLVDSRGFPLTPPEKELDRDAIAIRVEAGETITASTDRQEVFVIHARREDVLNYTREGNDLIVEFTDGKTLTIRDFFTGASPDQLVFMDGDQPYWAEFDRALNGADGINDDLIRWFIPVKDVAALGLLGWLGGLLAVGAVGAAMGGGGGDDNNGGGGGGVTPPPSQLDLTLSVNDDNNNGLITATGTTNSPGPVTVTWPDGSTVTTTVGSGGVWSVETTVIQPTGNVTATASDAIGNTATATQPTVAA